MVERIAAKTLAMARRRGLLEDEPCDALSRVQAESLQKSLPLAMDDRSKEKLAGFVDGFSLEAGSHVGATNRNGLEHMLRYMLRGPVANTRLHKLADGRVLLELKRVMHDGTREVAFTPRQLLGRLAAIVPPPRVHSTRYWGVFAPSSKTRPKIVSGGPRRRRGRGRGRPTVPEEIDDGGAEDARLAWELGRELDHPLSLEPPPMPERKRYLDWSQLLRRVFAEDVLTCSKCGGRRKVTAFIPSSREACEILEQLGIDATAPPIAPARAPPHQVECFELPPDDPGVDAQYPDS